MSAYHFTALLFTFLSLILPIYAYTLHPCSEDFVLEAHNRSMTCKKIILGAEFGWKYHNNTNRTLDILFGAKLDGAMGWLAWGVNPEREAKMIGTRALIGIKLENQSLAHNTYNVTQFSKMGCGLQPSNVELGIRHFRFFYHDKMQLYVIEASIDLPPEYNISKMNLVWQIGGATAGMEPKMHTRKLANFDAKETVDLISGNTVIGSAHQKLRMIHGIVNIVGWGTLLPIGAIIARYFRRYPVSCGDNALSVHMCCQVLGWALGTIGWILGIWLGNASKYFGFPIHRTLGIIIFTFSTLQLFALQLKPEEENRYRKHWNMYHHFLGYSLLAVIIVNIFDGIRIISTDHTWKWAYIGLISLIGFIALSLECFTWIKFLRSKMKTGSHKDEQQNKKSDQTPQQNSGSQGNESNKDTKADNAGPGALRDLVQPSSSSDIQRS